MIGSASHLVRKREDLPRPQPKFLAFASMGRAGIAGSGLGIASLGILHLLDTALAHGSFIKMQGNLIDIVAPICFVAAIVLKKAASYFN